MIRSGPEDRTSGLVFTGTLLLGSAGLALFLTFLASLILGPLFQPRDGGLWEWGSWASALGFLFGPRIGTISISLLMTMALGLYLVVARLGVRWSLRRGMAWIAVCAGGLGILAWSARREACFTIELRDPDGRIVAITHYRNFFGPTRQVVNEKEY